MIKKLSKEPPSKIVASIPDTSYFVSKEGRIFRELKPTVINDKPYYNLVLDGVLRRVSREAIVEIIPSNV
jgi:hypothetical protein